MSCSYLDGKCRSDRESSMVSPSGEKSSRAIGLRFGEENSIEGRAELPENDEPESRHHETWHNSAWIHQRMEKQNVDDQRSSNGQRQRNRSSKEKQHTRDQLQPKNKHQVVRFKHDREILLGQFRCRRRL